MKLRISQLFATVLAALATSVSAQLQFDELAKRHLPTQYEETRAVALGDVDGDGDLDLIVGNSGVPSGGQNRLYLNNGDATFLDATAQRLPVDSDWTTAIALGDVDGDGDLDVVCGNGTPPRSLSGQQNRLYLNDGTGTFRDATAAAMPVDQDVSHAVALGDVDGDGDLDMIVGNASSQNRLYLNDGTGAYADATAARLPVDQDGTEAVVLGDVDGDGDLDLVAGNAREQNRLYLNDGSGTFTDVTVSRMPTDNDWTMAVALGDVDGDGDLDLVSGNVVLTAGNTGQNRLYLNDGSGTFANATAANMPVDQDSTLAVALGDVDGDGDLDLFVGNGWVSFFGAYEQQNRLYLNVGAGKYADATPARVPAVEDATCAVVVGDADGDGDLDLVSGNVGLGGNTGQNRLCLNDGAGAFRDGTAARMPATRNDTAAVAMGDVDGDGDLDVVFANHDYGPYRNRLCLNDGYGRYADAAAGQLPDDSSRAVVMGDVDGDGDLDLVFGNVDYGASAAPGGQHQNRLLLNDGAGTFTDVTAARLPVDTDQTVALALGDVDGDGDVDLILGNDQGPNRLYVNDGTGTYTDATALRLPSSGGLTRAVVLGDVDGDGDLDLVAGNAQEQNRLLLNDGSGTFTDVTASRMPVDNDPTMAVALGDVDGDGDLDMVIGNGWPQSQSRLYLNDGSGTFADATATRMPVGQEGTETVAVGDVDGDGDADIVLGKIGLRMELYANDGSGTFVDVSAARMPPAPGFVVALGDVDGDGDLDLVAGNSGGGYGAQNKVYLNLQRQLDAPFLAMPGHAYRLDVYARHGTARQQDVALPWLSTGRASIPLPPIGTFGLDPTQIVALPRAVVPQPAGVAAISITVPNAPALAGVAIYAQALLLHDSVPAPARLTNVTTDVIR